MYEIKILQGPAIDVQKKLNTWKHNFSIKVQSFQPCPHTKGDVYAMVCRTKKAGK